jgi:hypothetical protein
MNRISGFRGLTLTSVLTASIVAGCGNNNDAVPVPSVEQTKAIAEEGFIYGLPVVINYAVMNEYSVDRNSGQFKAPFNQIKNEHRVFTYEDTAVVTPNSDTPLLDTLAGSTSGAHGALGASGAQESVLLGAVDRRQYLQLWLHRQPRHRQRAG